MLKTIQYIDREDIPKDVVEHLDEEGIYLQELPSIISVTDDGNPFSEWLKTQGFVFSRKPNWDWLAIFR